jgi:hypothetical protein
MNFNNFTVILNYNMRKPIRLKEISRIRDQIKIVREHLNQNESNSNSGARVNQPMIGASTTALDPKIKVKGLFEMFGVIPKV